jgi:hypothetical protein
VARIGFVVGFLLTAAVLQLAGLGVVALVGRALPLRSDVAQGGLMMHRFPALPLSLSRSAPWLARLPWPRPILPPRARRSMPVRQDWPDLQALYQDIHSHPETAFRETRTADVLARQLKAMGVDVTTGVGKTGIVGVIHNGAGPVVLLRTELDALPMEERPACLMPVARSRPVPTARPRSSTMPVATISTWPGGSARRGRSWP